MPEIILSGECGNSPKNAFAEQLAVALMTGDDRNLSEWLTPDCSADLPGPGHLDGVAAIGSAMKKQAANLDRIEIHHAITHGRVGAVNGEVSAAGTRRGFALVFEFRNTKADSVAAIRLYLA